ncbi:YjiH family protein [Pseudalkalibacillus berkeleyi]|uniref:YjiH family protein n=1 Tax=Pseudalkalibacillus berkeleyi TaxID=1069813 RepID=A0ABS9H117_9BACL|nr:YjiH family protein [Pseudalkalibacillus berkeleyi]MCF6137525.1 YjiH family protein [Pseudalkalibacillus berkeleyi]
MEAEKRKVNLQESTLETQTDPQSLTIGAYLKFILPSLLGIFLFLVPVTYQGKLTIGVGILAESVNGWFGDYIPHVMTTVFCLSVFLVIYAKTVKPLWLETNSFLKDLFDINPFWLSMRVVGSIFAIMTLMKWGPEWIWSETTGGTVLYALVPVLATWFLFAGLLMPLLLEFGLMEFIGTMVQKVMKPLFRLPGRSSIDAVASWMGSGTVGVLITTKQYEEGYYTKREAAVVATTFSITSIAFSLVVISFIGLDHLFVPFYITVVIAGIVAAVVCPRIPPLSRKKDTYYEPVGKQIEESVPTEASRVKWSIKSGVRKAAQVKDLTIVVRKGIENVLDIWFSLIPLVMALGTISLVIAEFTPIFSYLAYPLVPLLEWMQIPEAAEAAPAMIVGFADMFLPAVLGSGIESELTRFVIAGISLTQLIYMSEIGILLIKSKIPISFLELVIIFIQRTLITLPIIVLIAHLFIF